MSRAKKPQWLKLTPYPIRFGLFLEREPWEREMKVMKMSAKWPAGLHPEGYTCRGLTRFNAEYMVIAVAVSPPRDADEYIEFLCTLMHELTHAVQYMGQATGTPLDDESAAYWGEHLFAHCIEQHAEWESRQPALPPDEETL